MCDDIKDHYRADRHAQGASGAEKPYGKPFAGAARHSGQAHPRRVEGGRTEPAGEEDEDEQGEVGGDGDQAEQTRAEDGSRGADQPPAEPVGERPEERLHHRGAHRKGGYQEGQCGLAQLEALLKARQKRREHPEEAVVAGVCQRQQQVESAPT